MSLLPVRSVGGPDPADDVNTIVTAVDLKVDRGERFVNVTDYGAVCDLTADDTAEIQAAIDAAHAAGGGDVLIPGKCKVSGTLNMYTNVFLVGLGGEDHHDSGSMFQQTRSALYWYGAAGGTMINFSSVVDYPSGQKSIGGGLLNLALHSGFGANKADVGIKIRSWDCGVVDRVYTHEFQDVAWDIGCLDDGSIGEAHDTQQWEFRNISGRQIAAGPAGGGFIRLSGNEASTFVTRYANCSYNQFYNTMANYDGCLGNGVYDLRACDNNRFYSPRARASNPGTSDAIVCHAGATSENCRANAFYDYSGSGAVRVMGTEEAATPSHDNSFWYMDSGNAVAAPIIGTGVTGVSWSFPDGTQGGAALVKSGVGDSRANAQLALTGVTTESLRILNTASNHLRFTDATGTNTWMIAVDAATGDLKLQRISGTGRINLVTASKFTSTVGFNNTTPPAQPAAYTQTYATASRTHPALTSLAAPAGGTGTAAGGWDTAANRDLAITTINALRTDVTNLKQLVNQILDDLQTYGLLA